MNRINERKEFFRVSIDEISQVVRELAGEVELTRVAAAAEFRKTQALLAEESGRSATNMLADQMATAARRADPTVSGTPAEAPAALRPRARV